MFKSTRVGKRNKMDEHKSDGSRVANSITRTYAPFPSPYHYQGRSESTNPVLMHEPYQRYDRAEYQQHSPRSPSPASPTTSGHYFGDMASYSGPPRAVRSNSYVEHPISPTGPSPYTSHYQSPTAHAIGPVMASSTQNYSPRTSCSPWVNHDSYYYSRQSHGGPASSQSTSPLPYHHSNGTSAGHTPQQTSPRPSHPNYSPSYSLQSALTPFQPMSDYRGVSLAPLQIPLQHYTSARQCQTPPDSATVMEEDQPGEDQSGLAPLNELKRQSRYRREPSDEKTLRLLIASQSTPP